MKAYKGFNKDMTCRGFQFEEGATYEESEAELCYRGFHACEDPLDCLSYYSLNGSEFHEVELEEVSDEREFDSKVCAKRIKIGAKLSIGNMVEASIDYVRAKIDSATTGNEAHSATTGNRAHSATTGNEAHSATTGDWAHSATTGNWAHSATTGDWAHSEVKGKHAIAAALGGESKARGGLDCWLVLAEWKESAGEWEPVNVRSVKVDGEKIKPGVWYKIENGEFVETEVDAE